MKFTGAEFIIKMLEKHGISIISGIPGGSNLPIYNALFKSSITHVLTRHEQGAGFIAQGMARSTGKAAVCFATSGPGATNLVTAIADAKLDSVPIIAITGQVPTTLLGTDAFQEVDTFGMTLSLTKHNYLVKDIRQLPDIMTESFMIAQSGRPGPVLIDVPKDVQTGTIELDQLPDPVEPGFYCDIDPADVQHLADLINKSKKPVIYAGGGIISSNASGLLYTLSKKSSIPVTLTLMGLGCYPPDEPLYLGMIGMHGSRPTNLIINDADLILGFGVRFDDRATGNIKQFCPNAQIVHVDIDKAEINKIRTPDLSITGDIKTVFEQLIPLVNETKRAAWANHVQSMKRDCPSGIIPANDGCMHPANFIKSLSTLVEHDTIIATDVGQHQMWVAQSYPFYRPRTLLTSGGLGTMGFGLPASIGAALANPDKQVICISGDGSILMNIQELATLADLNLNIKIFIMNNKHLGLVRQQQELFYDRNYIASRFITNPDFGTIAKGFGINNIDLENTSDPAGMTVELLTKPGPCLINVPVNPNENVVPIVPPGKANYEMVG
jgi:acetolactate synthase-1/2/3 large subunit